MSKEQAQAKCDSRQPRLLAAEKAYVRELHGAEQDAKDCEVSQALLHAIRINKEALLLQIKAMHNTLELAAQDAGATPQSGGGPKDGDEE